MFYKTFTKKKYHFHHLFIKLLSPSFLSILERKFFSELREKTLGPYHHFPLSPSQPNTFQKVFSPHSLSLSLSFFFSSSLKSTLPNTSLALSGFPVDVDFCSNLHWWIPLKWPLFFLYLLVDSDRVASLSILLRVCVYFLFVLRAFSSRMLNAINAIF